MSNPPAPLHERFAEIVSWKPISELWPDNGAPSDDLLIETIYPNRSRIPLRVYYAPFDHVNRDAKVIILGVTPGRQQARMATTMFERCLHWGQGTDEALRRAKVYASFGGPMRDRLVAMLNRFRVNELLGIRSCASLWGGSTHLAQFCSGLRYPVLIGENYANYTGLPSPLKVEGLRRWLSLLPDMIRSVPDALVIPLGAAMHEVCRDFAARGEIDEGRLLIGIEHPSGANNGASGYLLQPRPRHTYPTRSSIGFERIDRNRELLDARMADLIAKQRTHHLR